MKNTIKRYPHFKLIMNLGTKTVLKSCVIYQIPFSDFSKKFKRYQPPAPFGIMVTKKLGNAVQRNFIKRRLRSAIQNTNLQNNCTIFVGRKQCETMDFTKITQEISNSISQI